MAYSFPPIDPNNFLGIPFPHMIQLGTVTDAEEDAFIIWFNNDGNDFITFDELLMVLLVDPMADPGIYYCTIVLADLNESQPLSAEYKFEINLGEVEKEEEEAVAAAEAVDDLPGLVVEGVDRLGVLTIRFTMEMTVPSDYSIVDDTVL